uniref:Uncharacterized protein n=1 Tax=Bicosoecida sp. CB-2014 TaxID=1486930 RepID=A0A7S1CD74_9STRA
MAAIGGDEEESNRLIEALAEGDGEGEGDSGGGGGGGDGGGAGVADAAAAPEALEGEGDAEAGPAEEPRRVMVKVMSDRAPADGGAGFGGGRGAGGSELSAAEVARRRHARGGGKPDNCLSRTATVDQRACTAVNWLVFVYGPVMLISILPVLLTPFTEAIFLVPLMCGIFLPGLVGLFCMLACGFPEAIGRVGAPLWLTMLAVTGFTISVGISAQRPMRVAHASVVDDGWDVLAIDREFRSVDEMRQMFVASPTLVADASMLQEVWPGSEGFGDKWCLVPTGPVIDGKVPSWYGCAYHVDGSEVMSCEAMLRGDVSEFYVPPDDSDGISLSQSEYARTDECFRALATLMPEFGGDRDPGTTVVLDRLPGMDSASEATRAIRSTNMTTAITPQLRKADSATDSYEESEVGEALLLPKLGYGDFERELVTGFSIAWLLLWLCMMAPWVHKVERCYWCAD